MAFSGSFRIPWDAAEEDDLGGWSAGDPDDYYVQRAGWYLICANARRSAVTLSAQAECRISHNGVQRARATLPSTSTVSEPAVSTMILCEVGDTLGVVVVGPVAPTTATILAVTTSFSLARIGPHRWT